MLRVYMVFGLEEFIIQFNVWKEGEKIDVRRIKEIEREESR